MMEKLGGNDVCRPPVSPDFVQSVLDLSLYTDVSCLVALTKPDDPNNDDAKVVGLIAFGSHSPDIPTDMVVNPPIPSMEWSDATVDRLAEGGHLAEIYLSCKAADGCGGLGRYLTAHAIWILAKQRRRKAPRYRGVVCSIAHHPRRGVRSVRDEANYKLMTLFGAKRVGTVLRGTKRNFVQKGDGNASRPYMALVGVQGHRWTPNAKIKNILKIPAEFTDVCPDVPRTGRQRCL